MTSFLLFGATHSIGSELRTRGLLRLFSCRRVNQNNFEVYLRPPALPFPNWRRFPVKNQLPQVWHFNHPLVVWIRGLTIRPPGSFKSKTIPDPQTAGLQTTKQRGKLILCPGPAAFQLRIFAAHASLAARAAMGEAIPKSKLAQFVVCFWAVFLTHCGHELCSGHLMHIWLCGGRLPTGLHMWFAQNVES